MKKSDGGDSCTVPVVMDEQSREIYLFGSVDESMASQAILAIRRLDSIGTDNITLIIQSDGGDEGSGWAIYDALRLARCKIVGQCYGVCMSIMALILQACDTRLLAPNCRFMIHDGNTDYGPASLREVRTLLKEENILTQMYYEGLAEKSELSVDKVKKLCEDESYMDANVAVGYGFADAILGQTKKRKGKK